MPQLLRLYAIERSENKLSEEKQTQEHQCPLCQKCQFYIKETNACKVKEVNKCDEAEINSCTDFLISEKLIYF